MLPVCHLAKCHPQQAPTPPLEEGTGMEIRCSREHAQEIYSVKTHPNMLQMLHACCSSFQKGRPFQLRTQNRLSAHGAIILTAMLCLPSDPLVLEPREGTLEHDPTVFLSTPTFSLFCVIVKAPYSTIHFSLPFWVDFGRWGGCAVGQVSLDPVHLV